MGDRTGTICGTIQYMAPEILGVEPYDHSVDWWSLGILIYALLSGEYPLNAAKDHIQMNERVSKHIFELDRTRGTYTDEACELVRKLLRKNPNRRLKSLDDIKREPFFLKEVNSFVNNYLKEEKRHQKLKTRKKNKSKANEHSDSDSETNIDDDDDYEEEDEVIEEFNFEKNEDLNKKKAMISENFWNPYVIMQSYSPLQLLFDEIYALKQKQLLKKAEIKKQQFTEEVDQFIEEGGGADGQGKKESMTYFQEAVTTYNTASLLPPLATELNQDEYETDFVERQSNLEHNNSFTKF
jgi:serine/threonine protein kinase